MLLRESELSLPEIADRMRCSRSAVASINRKFQVRVYEGRRSQWSVNGSITVVDRPAVSDSQPEVVKDFVRSDS
jgi:hypothetical protein